MTIERYKTQVHKINLKNFRCFGEPQVARLAPLTFLVGENNAGKTSFMAMIRNLLILASDERTNFKEKPYDLGTFKEIVHDNSDSFEGGFSTRIPINESEEIKNQSPHYAECNFSVTFEKGDSTIPIPKCRRFSLDDSFIELDCRSDLLTFGIRDRRWDFHVPFFDGSSSLFKVSLLFTSKLISSEFLAGNIQQSNVSSLFLDEDLEKLSPLFNAFVNFVYEYRGNSNERHASNVFASAPIRSKPRRTYDPTGNYTDSEGEFIPMYLASLSIQYPEKWEKLNKLLTKFGRDSDLYDEIIVKSYGRTEAEPFQLQIRESGSQAESQLRNLIDVGYGVSQILPIITELFRQDAYSMSLLQQPEVHLHPRAQAAFGSLLCKVANSNHQLLVETHSDYILDRVMTEIRDGKCPLKPEDVSILFFERLGLGVKIHSLRLNENGEILDAPEVYRKFFFEELNKVLGFS